MRRAALVALLALLALAGCGGDDDESTPRLVVSAASSMTEALNSCGPDFESADVRLSFAGSDELAAQIRQGVKPDVYAAANTQASRRAQQGGTALEARRSSRRTSS